MEEQCVYRKNKRSANIRVTIIYRFYWLLFSSRVFFKDRRLKVYFLSSPSRHAPRSTQSLIWVASKIFLVLSERHWTFEPVKKYLNKLIGQTFLPFHLIFASRLPLYFSNLFLHIYLSLIGFFDGRRFTKIHYLTQTMHPCFTILLLCVCLSIMVIWGYRYCPNLQMYSAPVMTSLSWGDSHKLITWKPLRFYSTILFLFT